MDDARPPEGSVMKKILKKSMTLLAIFLISVATVLLLDYHAVTSSELKSISTNSKLDNGNAIITIAYVNKRNEVSVAADKGYAIVRKTMNQDGYSILEDILMLMVNQRISRQDIVLFLVSFVMGNL